METNSNTQTKNQKQEENKYFFNYILDPETPLFHNDIYAFLNQVYKSNNILSELVQKYLPDLHEKGLPDKLYKNFVINEIIKPLKNNGKEMDFKNELIEHINKHVKEKKDNIKEYYQNYVIKPDTPLFDNDIFAFLNKIPSGRKYLQEITNIELPPRLDKNYVINNIVKPLKEAGVEKEIKASLIDIVENYDTIKKGENKSIKEYFKNYEIWVDAEISHKDIYAFIAKMPKKEGINYLKMAFPDVQFPENNKDFNRNFVIKQIVEPIKNQGLDKYFKERLNDTIKRSNIKNNHITPSDTQIKKIDEIIDLLKYEIKIGKALVSYKHNTFEYNRGFEIEQDIESSFSGFTFGLQNEYDKMRNYSIYEVPNGTIGAIEGDSNVVEPISKVIQQLEYLKTGREIYNVPIFSSNELGYFSIEDIDTLHEITLNYEHYIEIRDAIEIEKEIEQGEKQEQGEEQEPKKMRMKR